MPHYYYQPTPALLHAFEGLLKIVLETEIKRDYFAIDHGRSRVSRHEIERPVSGVHLAQHVMDHSLIRRREYAFKKAPSRGFDMAIAIDVYRASLPSLLAVDGSRL